jgi:AraC-like DNA-binding protein
MYRERASTIPGARVWRGTSDGSVRRVLPDGCMDLLWMDGRLVVAGPDREAFVAPGRPGAVTTGLRFAPGTAPRVLAVPAGSLRNQRVPLEELWSRREVARAEELVAASPHPGRALEQVVASFGRGSPQPDGAVAEVVRLARSGARVAAMARAVGMSARQLQRRSEEWFGYGPKVLARILRLVDALELARQGTPLAAVAASCGYADQAHLADDVRDLTGTTLTGLGLGARVQVDDAAGRAANRSTGLPSGSRTVA